MLLYPQKELTINGLSFADDRFREFCGRLPQTNAHEKTFFLILSNASRQVAVTMKLGHARRKKCQKRRVAPISSKSGRDRSMWL
jgi:hypothetical protein